MQSTRHRHTVDLQESAPLAILPFLSSLFSQQFSLAVWFCFSFSYSEKEHFSGSNVTCRYSENQCLVYILLVLYSLQSTVREAGEQDSVFSRWEDSDGESRGVFPRPPGFSMADLTSGFLWWPQAAFPTSWGQARPFVKDFFFSL